MEDHHLHAPDTSNDHYTLPRVRSGEIGGADQIVLFKAPEPGPVEALEQRI